MSILMHDVRDEAVVGEAVRESSVVFHLAAQVAVTTSLVEPMSDFTTNVAATLSLLETLRSKVDGTGVIFASTNKVYGDLADVELERVDSAYLPRNTELRTRGISEEHPLDFHTPYGCSKGAADQYVLDYARSFGVPAAVLRMSCIYGPRQMGTEDQGWVAHFASCALASETINIYGDGLQVRDILFVDDAVEAYVRAWRRLRAISGRAYNLGGGPANSVSIIQLIRYLEQILGHPVTASFSSWRSGDQRYYASDIRRALRDLELPVPTPWRSGVARLVQWLSEPDEIASQAPPRERQMAGA
jgi:CDP-paratose 2-epimerase